jgi:predicted Rossmann-fold nucleotide-binding protein
VDTTDFDPATNETNIVTGTGTSTMESINPSARMTFRCCVMRSKGWVTLITCQGYDEQQDAYRSRMVVRAVLMEVTQP